MSSDWEIKVWHDPNLFWLERVVFGGQWEWTARPTNMFESIDKWGRGRARTKEKALRQVDKWIVSMESSYEARTKGLS